ncbi:hypothetical protein KBZ10_10935 [Streptomyces sp. F63]|uniref:hypothetical protein n=1 Tax=Streptomyces sp. F63 TaxID=2824887 RepID=UPI001B38A2C2|nr:hypothetical protein [Streptomyces sp. F63]MBQ0985021.1 hypothetical protein [Streptomyces sp. F63]
MSNSYAQPILRTTDLARARQVVGQLLGIADTNELEVDFEARVFSARALTPLRELLPDPDWWSEGGGDTSSDQGGAASAHLPVRLQSWSMSPDSVEPLLKAVGESPATVRWDFSGWPEAPDVGLGTGGSRGAYVTLCVNARDLDLTEPATDHSVFVHVKQVEAERAPWLAAQAGLRVIGDLVMAPH